MAGFDLSNLLAAVEKCDSILSEEDQLNSKFNKVIKSFSVLYDTGVLIDMTLVCRGTELKAHKVVLFLQSPVFRKMFTGNFKEAATQSSRIELDDDPNVLQALLSYFYKLNYDDTMRGAIPIQQYTVYVYSIADKYDVPRLQDMTAEKFENICDAVEDSDDFIDAVYAIHSSTNPKDRRLRNVVLPAIQDNISWLLELEKFKTLVDAIPELKWELLALIGRGRVSRSRENSCGRDRN